MLNADKISPEVPLTYWMLNFPTLMRFLCKKKFGAFGKNSEIRIVSFIDVCSRIYIGNNVTVRPGSFIYARFYRGSDNLAMLAFISVWVTSEWIRSWFLTGFPWLYLGYGAMGSWLENFSPFLGVFGVSFVCLYISLI